MNIGLAIIASLVIVYVRIRIINTIFSDKKVKIHLTLKICVIALLLVGSLFFYKYILSSIGKSQLYFLETTDRQTIGLFIFYCVAFLLLLTTFLKGRYKKIVEVILGGAVCFVAIGYGGYLLGIPSVILYYLIAAYAEEYFKFSSGNDLFVKEASTNTRDLIFFCMLMGLGFSIVENIFYVTYSFLHHEQISLVSLTLGRGLISTLLHVICTGLIAYIMISIQKTKNIFLSLITGIVVGRGMHSLYNVSLEYHMQYVSIPLIIVCFFLLSYLLYQSDILYEKT